MARKDAKTWETENAPFPSRLSEIMKERQVSQEKLANALGVKRQTVSLYKTGQSSPNAEQLRKIAEFFEVSADWLLGLSETKSTSSDIQQVCAQTGISENIVRMLLMMPKTGQDGTNSTALIQNFNKLFQDSGYNLYNLLVELGEYSECQKLTIQFCNSIRHDLKNAKKTVEIEDVDIHEFLDGLFERLEETRRENRYQRFECIDALMKSFDVSFHTNDTDQLIQEIFNLISETRNLYG